MDESQLEEPLSDSNTHPCHVSRPESTVAASPPDSADPRFPAWLSERLLKPLPQRHPASMGAPELNYGRHSMPPVPGARRAAVLILLYPAACGWTIPLTLRPDSLPVHAGQVSLPGGRVQGDETAEQTACREFEEELGCSSRGFLPLGQLSRLFVYGTNFNVQPCVFRAPARPDWRPNAAEVARVLELPLSELVNRRRHGAHWIRRGPFRFRAPHLRWDGERIWGATRIVLAELAALVDEWNG